MALLLAGILVLAHLAIAVTTALLIARLVVPAMLRLIAAMAVARERRREPLAHVLHVDVGDRDFASADSGTLAFILRRHDAVIVVGMLEEVLRRDAVTGRAGVARELQIFLEHLIGVAAHPDVGAAAIVGMRLALPAAAAMSTMRAAVRFTRAASAASSILVIRSHASITSHCCGPGFALRSIAPQGNPAAVKSGNAPNHLQVLLHPGTAIPMSGAVSGVQVSPRLSPAVVFRMITPKAEATVAGSGPISNSFLHRQKARI
jgi:hypothetical protein